MTGFYDLVCYCFNLGFWGGLLSGFVYCLLVYWFTIIDLFGRLQLLGLLYGYCLGLGCSVLLGFGLKVLVCLVFAFGFWI